MKIFAGKLSSNTVISITLLSITSLFFLVGCNPEDPQSTFGDKGPIAKQQKDLFILIFWVAAFVFIAVEGALIFLLFKYRYKDDKLPYQSHGNTKLEILWTIIPAIILTVITIPTIQVIWDQQNGVPDDMGEPLRVEAVGHQWWFEFRYPDLEIVTANELHIPIDRPISIKLGSDDVIHSFWIPKLAGKLDMIPLNDNYMWLIADEPGMYYGQCAEFCGVAHALMRFRAIAETEQDFDKWVDGMRTEPNPPITDSEKNGMQVFMGKCSMCHTKDSYSPGSYAREIKTQKSRWEIWLNDTENAPQVSAPNLTHFGLRNTVAAGIKEFSKENPENLINWIEDPSSIKIGNRMQKHASIYTTEENKLSASEIQDVSNYLLSLKPNIE